MLGLIKLFPHGACIHLKSNVQYENIGLIFLNEGLNDPQIFLIIIISWFTLHFCLKRTVT